MKCTILLSCFFALAMGNTDTCKAGEDACVATPDEDELSLIQTRAQVKSLEDDARKVHTYGPYVSLPALEFFKHWSLGKIEGHMRSLIDEEPSASSPDDLALGQRAMTTADRVVEFLNMHRLRECPDSLTDDQYSLHDSSIDRMPRHQVEHFVLQSPKGSLQYVAKHEHQIIAAYPALCASHPDALFQMEKPAADKEVSKVDPPKQAGKPQNLDPNTDKLSKQCEDLFHRTAMETCGHDFAMTVNSATEMVIDGLGVELAVEITPKDGGDAKLHDISCSFSVGSKNDDAELLQGDADPKKSTKKKTKSVEDPKHRPKLKDMLPSEKQGLVAKLEMEINLCKSDKKSTMSAADVLFFALAKKMPMGELSRYKGFEHVNDDLPRVTESVLQVEGNVAATVDLRVDYPECYPDSFKEVVRDQGQCGSCWAFASATSTMNNLCASGKGGTQTLKGKADRYEVSVQQIMSCNSKKCGCSGGFASAANDAMKTGITRERDSKYACGGGDPLNHFDVASTTCDKAPWGATCNNKKLAYKGWNWGGASGADGEAAMKKVLSQGFAMYGSFDVYSNFMKLKDEIFKKTIGAKKGGHAVAVVGYGASPAGTAYWVLQNSWGTSWGVNGYGKILRGTNLCGIEKGAYYMRAWVSNAAKVPPCFDAADTGLNGGGGPIKCKDAITGGFGNLCTNKGFPQVATNCPTTCNSCKGGAKGPAPMPAPPPTKAPAPAATPAPTPAPAPTTCKDSATYKDPYFGDACKNWASFTCTGQSFSKELIAQCPIACKTCDPKTDCANDPSYTDPTWGMSCLQWKHYSCKGTAEDGWTPDISVALQKACPASCKVCHLKK